MIAIIKYNAGNIQSVKNALNRLGQEVIVTDDKDIILQSDRVVLPGVGAASSAMADLSRSGLDEVIKQIQKPFLGICLGLQLLCNHSEEGDTPCLGIFDAKVKRFSTVQKVPHMGWNTIYDLKSTLFENVPEPSDVYFVHSYYAELCQDTVGTCDYILPFSAVLQKDNYYATQFHVEKSASIGERILQNFLEQ